MRIKNRRLREEKGSQIHKMDQTGVGEIKSKRKEEEEEEEEEEDRVKI